MITGIKSIPRHVATILVAAAAAAAAATATATHAFEQQHSHTARGTEHDRRIKSIPRNGIPHTAEWYKISLGLPDAAAATTTT